MNILRVKDDLFFSLVICVYILYSIKIKLKKCVPGISKNIHNSLSLILLEHHFITNIIQQLLLSSTV